MASILMTRGRKRPPPGTHRVKKSLMDEYYKSIHSLTINGHYRYWSWCCINHSCSKSHQHVKGQKLQKDFPGNKPVYLHFCNFGLYLQLFCNFCLKLSICKNSVHLSLIWCWFVYSLLVVTINNKILVQFLRATTQSWVQSPVHWK